MGSLGSYQRGLSDNADIVDVGGVKTLAVSDLGSAGIGTGIIEYQTDTSVVGSVLTTVFDFTNTTGNTIYINSISGECNSSSEWEMLINGIIVYRTRTTAANLGFYLPFHRVSVANNVDVKVKLTNYETGFSECSVAMNYST